MERRCHAVLDAGRAAGIRYVDAARSYGRAEEFLASWLADRGIVPGEITVGSKWGYRYTGGWRLDAAVQERKDHSAGNLRRQLAQSRALLGAHLGLYQIHSATLESGVLEDAEVLTALVDLADSGVAVGLSVSGPHQGDVVRRALAVAVGGRNPFSAVQATWNVLEPSAGPALAAAHDRGWGVIVKEVLANGRLADRAARATERAVAQPWADVVLSGAVTTSQLGVGVAAVVGPAREQWRDAPGPEAPEAYWSRRSTLPWA